MIRPARHRLLNRDFLESVSRTYTRPDFIGLDPIRYVLRFKRPADQEAVGLVSACLAYGNVKQISASMDKLAEVMGDNPSAWLRDSTEGQRARALPGFQHRWTHREDILGLWSSMHRVLNDFGSLDACFASGIQDEESALEQGLNQLVAELQSDPASAGLRVLSRPAKGSACKRMMMYLRWMVRKDAVDPGPWTCLTPSQLKMPVDTHIFRTASRYHLTQRKSANWVTVNEITDRFREVCPEDPVRYDFALTRLGMKRPTALDDAVYDFWSGAARRSFALHPE